MFAEIATSVLLVRTIVNDVNDIRMECNEFCTTVRDVKTDIDALGAQVALKGKQMVLYINPASAYYDTPAAPSSQPVPFNVKVSVGDMELATPYWETAADIPF
jgi:hypothetical protein